MKKGKLLSKVQELIRNERINEIEKLIKEVEQARQQREITRLEKQAEFWKMLFISFITSFLIGLLFFFL